MKEFILITIGVAFFFLCLIGSFKLGVTYGSYQIGKQYDTAKEDINSLIKDFKGIRK